MASKLLFLPFAWLMVGCNPSDPVWDLPCGERPERSVLVGTGGEDFRVIDDQPLPIEYGDQGGSHIWVGVRLVGFGPQAAVQFGIVDADDPGTVYSGPNAEHPELSYNTEAVASEASGLFGFIEEGYDPETDMELPGPSGRNVVLWADVSDECGVLVHGETSAKVE